MSDPVKLPEPYNELVDRLLHLFGLKYLHWANEYQTLDFGSFTAHVVKERHSQTYMMWCADVRHELFFKMADYQLLNMWEPDVQKAVETLRDSMILDDVANA